MTFYPANRVTPETQLIGLIDAFEDPISNKLRDFWLLWARTAGVSLMIFNNTLRKLSHAAAAGELLRDMTEAGHRKKILTEFDFLPRCPPPTRATCLDRIKAAEYVTRDPVSMRLLRHGVPGAWFLEWDGAYTTLIDIRAGGCFNDPANLLAEDFPGRVDLIQGHDNFPADYGVTYPFGTHLFFSRHYGDPPETKIAGFDLEPILKGVKARIKKFERSLLRWKRKG